MTPSTKAVLVLAVACAITAATAYAWVSSPTGLHSNDNLRPETSAQREHWQGN